MSLGRGLVNPSTSSITIESGKIYSIANALAACVNSAANSTICNTLFVDTLSPFSDSLPADTLQAAVNMSYFPYRNVSAIYQLSVPQAPFIGLATAPNDWTIGVSYKTSSMGLGIAGTATSGTSSTIDIDSSGRIWVPSNMPGSTGVGFFDPSLNIFVGPITATGVTMVQPQYLAIDTLGFVWVADVLAPNLIRVDTNGIVAPTSVPLPGATAVGPISMDFSGDAYFSYTDSSGAPQLGYVSASTALFSTLASFTYNPTGLSWVSTLPSTAIDAVSASTSGSGTPCIQETLYDRAGVYTPDPNDPVTAGNCISGGSAYSFAYSSTLAAFSSLNEIAYGLSGTPGTTLPLSLPEGIATDGYSAV